MADAAGVAGEAEQRPPVEIITRSMRAYLALSVLTTGALALWAISLTEIDLRRMNDLGLVSVLPGKTYLALALVTISFCLSLREIEARKPLVVANVLVLILMLYAITPIVEHGPKLAAGWWGEKRRERRKKNRRRGSSPLKSLHHPSETFDSCTVRPIM